MAFDKRTQDNRTEEDRQLEIFENHFRYKELVKNNPKLKDQVKYKIEVNSLAKGMVACERVSKDFKIHQTLTSSRDKLPIMNANDPIQVYRVILAGEPSDVAKFNDLKCGDLVVLDSTGLVTEISKGLDTVYKFPTLEEDVYGCVVVLDQLILMKLNEYSAATETD